MSDSLINLLWGVLFCIVNFSLILVCYYLFGKAGLFTWIAISTIIANIQVTKTIEFWGIAATLGNVFYGSIFLSTDILNEKYGRREANHSIMLGFFANVLLVISMQMALFFRPYEGVDVAQEALNTIFGLIPRICFASLAAFLVSQFMDILIFNKIKKKFKGKHVWLRNNVATLSSQLLDTLVFVLGSFAFVYEWEVVLEIFLTTYLLKAVVAFLDTPFLYLARHIRPGILMGESPKGSPFIKLPKENLEETTDIPQE